MQLEIVAWVLFATLLIGWDDMQGNQLTFNSVPNVSWLSVVQDGENDLKRAVHGRSRSLVVGMMST